LWGDYILQNDYLATKAIFNVLKNEPRINKVTISGLGTGVGQLQYNVCARQMKQAYNDVWLNNYTFPISWLESQQRHYKLFQ
jgi:uncharacterized protein YneF (UPF0154 family)